VVRRGQRGLLHLRRPRRPLPPRDHGAFGAEAVNVAVQRRQPDSQLNWTERLIRRRRECPEIGHGDWAVLDVEAPGVLVHRCDWDGSTVVFVHDLAGAAATVALELELPEDADALADLFSDAVIELDAGRATLHLGPYDQRWFRVRRRGRRLPP
jgi:maltose alpha-D-glucosyltransferase/alpha-amylase